MSRLGCGLVIVFLESLWAMLCPEDGVSVAKGQDVVANRTTNGTLRPSDVSGNATLEAGLHSMDSVVRRRAIWRMADWGMEPGRVVDKVMNEEQKIGYARLVAGLGKPVLPRLYGLLADPDEEKRGFALALIALLGSPDADGPAALSKVDEEHPKDPVLHTVAQLLRGSSPEAAASHIAALKSDGAWTEIAVEWILSKDAGTRVVPIAHARARVENELDRLRSNGAEIGHIEQELELAIVSLAFAARTQALGNEEQSCLKNLQLEIEKPGCLLSAMAPEITLTRWLASGKLDAELLDKALAAFGKSVTGDEERILGWITVTFGDMILSSNDIPLLLSRAADDSADERVRVGALRLLTWLGPTSVAVHQVFRDLMKTESESEAIRLVLARGLPFLIENKPTGEGSLVEAARSRMSVEKSPSVRKALSLSVSRIEQCP